MSAIVAEGERQLAETHPQPDLADRSLIRANLVEYARLDQRKDHPWDETATDLADELERASTEIRTLRQTMRAAASLIRRNHYVKACDLIEAAIGKATP